MLVGAEGLTPSSVPIALPVGSLFDIALPALTASVPVSQHTVMNSTYSN